MFIERKRTPLSPLFGELLLDAGFVTSESLEESLRISRSSKMPLGRVLVISGAISDNDVDCTLKLQRLVREGKAPRESARQLMQIVHSNQITYDEAISLESFGAAFSLPLSRLAKLLLAARVCSAEVLEHAARASQSQKISVGSYLVCHNLLSAEIWLLAIECLLLVKDKKVSHLEAVQLLREIMSLRESGATIEYLSAPLEPYQQNASTPRLCVLLVESGAITVDQAGSIIESATENGVRVGYALLKAGLVSQETLDDALQLQEMIKLQQISFVRAAEILSLCIESEACVDDVLFDVKALNRAAQFLRVAGYVKEDAFRVIAVDEVEFNEYFGLIALRRELFNLEELDRASDCVELVEKGRLSSKQAYEVFLMSMGHDMPIYKTLTLMQWDADNRHGADELLGKIA